MKYFFHLSTGTIATYTYPNMPFLKIIPLKQKMGCPSSIVYLDKEALTFPASITYGEINSKIDDYFKNEIRKQKLEAI